MLAFGEVESGFLDLTEIVDVVDVETIVIVLCVLMGRRNPLSIGEEDAEIPLIGMSFTLRGRVFNQILHRGREMTTWNYPSQSGVDCD